jgi:excisionase family DNA binding protein
VESRQANISVDVPQTNLQADRRTNELPKLLGMSNVTILRRAKKGSIPSFRVGAMVRFDPQAISRWLLEQGNKSLSK